MTDLEGQKAMATSSTVPPSGSGRAGDGRTVAGTESASRVAAVLYLFTVGPASLGVSEASRELGLSKAVVHRIFQSLTARGFLLLDESTRTYRLGPASAALGARALRDLDMRSAARPVLEHLRDRTGETTTLSELVGESRVYLDQFESRQTIKMVVELGRAYPLHAGGSGKAILAFLPADVRNRVLTGRLEQLTAATITDSQRLSEDLMEFAARGYAVSLGERQHDAGSVAAPIFDSDQQVIGAISVCGPVSRFDPDSIASHGVAVCEAAAQISSALGWVGPDLAAHVSSEAADRQSRMSRR